MATCLANNKLSKTNKRKMTFLVMMEQLRVEQFICKEEIQISDQYRIHQGKNKLFKIREYCSREG